MKVVEIELPASEPKVIADPQGSPDRIEAFAKALARNADRFDDLEGIAQRALEIAWEGEASKAYRAAARKEMVKYRRSATTLMRLRKACLVHARELKALEDQATRLAERKCDLDQRLEQLRIDVRNAADVSDEDIARLQHKATSLRSGCFELVSDNDTLQVRIAENEKTMIAAFTANDTLTEAISNSAADKVAEAMARPGSPIPAVMGLFGFCPDPDATRKWWEGLSPDVRDAVVAAYPGLIGRTDGLPAGVRDDANRITLERDLAYLRMKRERGYAFSDLEKKALRNANAAEKALRKADNYRDPIDGSMPGGQLYLYDAYGFDGEGKIAIATGDLDTADNVAVRVPGITNDGSKAVKLSTEAQNIYQAARYADPSASVASMMWLGYDAPSSITDSATRSEDRAEVGGRQFAGTIEGLRASRLDDPGEASNRAHITAIGHSYGSTTVAQAAVNHRIDVDSIVLAGSPGAGPGVEHASQLGVGADNVFVARNSADGIPSVAGHETGGSDIRLGKDPADHTFGARRFEAEDGSETSWYKGPVEQHGRYFNPDTESLYNIDQVVADQPGQVNDADDIGTREILGIDTVVDLYHREHSGPDQVNDADDIEQREVLGIPTQDDKYHREHYGYDPERFRAPTSDEPGRSDTGPKVRD